MLVASFVIMVVLVTVLHGPLSALYISGGSGSLASFFGWLLPYVPFEALLFVLVGIPIALAAFFAIDRKFLRPLRQVCDVMAEFAKSTDPTQLVVPPGAPRELSNFVIVFNQFAQRVEEAHNRDVENARVKSDFISTAAHQLRTPLTGIRWALEALQKEELTESQRQLIGSAVEKSHDLVATVGTLLDITSIESGKYAYKFELQDLSQFVGTTAQDFTPAATAAQVGFRFDPAAVPVPVSIDIDRMKWVLNNLIENAIRYTPAGGSVQVTVEAVPGRAIARVRDTGIGIPQKDRNNIFERFYRAGNAITKQNQGNGLGLYIARTIAQDHRGELSFEQNQEGPGTTFTLALPLAAA